MSKHSFVLSEKLAIYKILYLKKLESKTVLGIFTLYFVDVMTPEKKIVPCPRCKTPNSVDTENGYVPKGLKCITCHAQIS
jgi:hypothetical protein